MKNLFGKKLTSTKNFSLAPRRPGDPPIPKQLEDQLRALGIDPANATLAPEDPHENPDGFFEAAPQSGWRLRHTFAFPTLNAVFAAIERNLDDETVASVSKESGRWVVAFDHPNDPKNDDGAEHTRIAQRVIDLGAEDRGFVRESFIRKRIQK